MVDRVRSSRKSCRRLNEAVIGESIEDDDALLAAIEGEYEADDFEMPWLPPEDFLQPLIRARENLGPVTEFTRE